MQVVLGFVLLFSWGALVTSALPGAKLNGNELKNLVIDTDFLSFPDDVGAIALANVFQRLGKARIVGIASDVNSRFSIPAIDAINTYYGHPDLFFAQNRSVTNDTREPDVDPTTPVYVTTLANASLFPQDVRDGSNATIKAPLDFYRHVLARAADKSLTLVCIGFFNNLAELYHSAGGKQLIESKVAELVVQGGNFGPNLSGNGPNDIGYNLGNSLEAARVLETWPSPVTFLGENIGASVFTGAVLKNTPPSNPVRAGFEIFLGGTGLKARSWDILATYFSVMGISEGSLRYGNRGGRIEIFDNGTAGWNEAAGVPHSRRQHFLDFRELNTTIAEKLDRLLALPPTI